MIRARLTAFSTLLPAILATVVATALDARQAPTPQPATQHHMEHRFDDPERWAKSFDDPARDQWQMPSRVIEALRLKAGESIADIGAGTGYFTVRLAKAAPTATVYAVDIEPAMVGHLAKRAKAEQLANVVAVQAAGDRPNLPQPVDLVLIVDTYHHLPNRVAYFKGLSASLKPSGRVAIIDFRKDSPEGPPVEFRFMPEQIESELRQAGYQVDARHDFLPRQHFLIFRRAN